MARVVLRAAVVIVCLAVLYVIAHA